MNIISMNIGIILETKELEKTLNAFRVSPMHK